jgi:hypothetical protein
MFDTVILIAFKIVFSRKYIKIIYIFFKFIFNISISIQFKNIKKYFKFLSNNVYSVF